MSCGARSGLWFLRVALAVTACTDESASLPALDALGFTDVRFTGYAWFDCADKDTFATAFTARNAAGKPVSGAVCCGVWKNCTVRF